MTLPPNSHKNEAAGSEWGGFAGICVKHGIPADMTAYKQKSVSHNALNAGDGNNTAEQNKQKI
jgi:hypothetical protein